MNCTLSPFPVDDQAACERAAWLLVESFRDNWPNAWPTLAAGLEEVAECLDEEMICLGAFSADQTLLGWIGARPQYDGNVWELHPLVVDQAARRQGIGRLLMQALEKGVAARGGCTIFLGTDDENGMTSLAGVDLYDDLWGQIARIRNLREHPFSFYQRMGYTIVGVVPDANGPGKPDILMAKKVGMIDR